MVLCVFFFNDTKIKKNRHIWSKRTWHLLRLKHIFFIHLHKELSELKVLMAIIMHVQICRKEILPGEFANISHVSAENRTKIEDDSFLIKVDNN